MLGKLLTSVEDASKGAENGAEPERPNSPEAVGEDADRNRSEYSSHEQTGDN